MAGKFKRCSLFHNDRARVRAYARVCVCACIFGAAVAVDRGEGVALKLPRAWVEGEETG